MKVGDRVRHRTGIEGTIESFPNSATVYVRYKGRRESWAVSNLDVAVTESSILQALAHAERALLDNKPVQAFQIIHNLRVSLAD